MSGWVILLRHLVRECLVLRERAGTTILVETMRKDETGDQGTEKCCGPSISIHRKLTHPRRRLKPRTARVKGGAKPDEE